MEQKPIIDHIGDFLEYVDIERGLSRSTKINYQRCLRKFTKWLEINHKEGMKPEKLTNDDVWQYRLYLSKCLNRYGKPLAKPSQNYLLIALRNLLDYFLLKDIPSLSSRKITLAKYSEHEKPLKFLDLEQVRKLLDAPNVTKRKGLRDKAILETLFSTGLRVSELAALNKEQFNLIWNQEDFELGIVGKGNHPRTVFFSKSAIHWLKKYLESRNDDKEPLFINYKNSTEESTRLSRRSIERIVKEYAIKAGLPNFTSPHTLRHSYATDLLSQGVDLRSIQEFLGHKNIMTTQIYTHVTNKHLRDIHRQFHGGRSLGQLATQNSNPTANMAIILRP